VNLSVEPGYGGGRFEIDGQELPTTAARVEITQRLEYATMVTLAGQEPLLTSLRRRGLVVDSPRILARDAREVSPLKQPAGDAPPAPAPRTEPR
jgi:hypothetical protein